MHATSAARARPGDFHKSFVKAANLSVLMAKVQSMEIVVDES
jgi:hypothetical protein